MDAWHELGLGDPPEDGRLYVGKAEDSLVTRDVNTHFQNGRTGQSSLRRTLAALLPDQLRLVGIPRGLAKRETSAHFALAPAHDNRSPWRARIAAARKVMADDARAWPLSHPT